MARAGSRRVNFTSTYTHDQWDFIVTRAQQKDCPKSKVIQELVDLGIQQVRMEERVV